MGSPTVFKQSGGGGSNSSGEFVQDSFQDYTLPANTNVGLTDNSSTNVENIFVGNTDIPRYSEKILFIKDINPISDVTKWINQKPTYEVVFQNPDANIRMFAVGNIRLQNRSTGLTLQARSVDDEFYVTGVIRRLHWGVEVNQSSIATAQLITDGSVGSTIDFSNAPADASDFGVGCLGFKTHNISNATNDLHTYGLRAIQPETLKLGAVRVYFENIGANIQQPPGSSYFNKTKITNTIGATYSIPGTSLLGSVTDFYKITSGYSLSTNITPIINSIAVGASGTNQVNVEVGLGSSFPAGSGIVIQNGATSIIGSVVSVSTDTLTLGVTLPFGVSLPIYKTWSANATLQISATLYSQSFVWDSSIANSFDDTTGFGQTGFNNFYWSDPQAKYRFWGNNLQFVTKDGFRGVNGRGGTLGGQLQIDGYYSAAEILVAAGATSAFCATVMINGYPAYGISALISGLKRFTLFTDAGPGFNSAVINFGFTSTLDNLSIYKINLYERQTNLGGSFVSLGQIDTLETYVNPPAVNASVMARGLFKRLYADHIAYQGPWTRSVTISQAGGVCFIGSTSSCNIEQNFYGRRFSFIGTASSSLLCTLNGSSIAPPIGSMYDTGSDSFNKVILQPASGTLIIAGFDYTKTNSDLNVVTKTNYDSSVLDIPEYFFQADTPRNAKNGDIWIQNQANPAIVYMKLADLWQQVSITGTTDDPNIDSNYWGNGIDGELNTTASVNLSATTDGDVIVKQYTKLTINSGHTVTTDNRCKGLLIYVRGDAVINGTLTMSSRGANADPTITNAVPSTGLRFTKRKAGGIDTLSAPDFGGAAGVGAQLLAIEGANQGGVGGSNPPGKIYTVSRTGGAGGAGIFSTNDKANGGTSTTGSGGGGSGASNGAVNATGGDGSSGTCFSGGSGGGGAFAVGVTVDGGDASLNGGAGGSGQANGGGASGGGAGNNGGAGTSSPSLDGLNGTGGMLYLFVRGNLTLTGTISANGANGGGNVGTNAGGGGSGGGRILVLYSGTLNNTGSIIASGGAGGVGGAGTDGGAGGAGAVTIEVIDV